MKHFYFSQFLSLPFTEKNSTIYVDNKPLRIQQYPQILSFILFFVGAILFSLSAQQADEPSKYLKRSALTSAGAGTYMNNSAQLQVKVQYAMGQSGPLGTVQKQGYQIRQGFIQPHSNGSPPVNISENQLSIFPSPFSNLINIHFEKLVDADIHVTIFDVRGRVIFQQLFPPQQYLTLDVDRLAVAKYMLLIETGNNKTLKHILKNNH